MTQQMSTPQLIKPQVKDLGGFSVRRLLPQATHRMVGPWVFFDHMGPAPFEAGQGIDVRPHPHIHLATVTYLFEGSLLHRDSLGTVQTIAPGDINLMVAGRGIVHSERTPPDIRGAGHTAHGLQLWLSLPEENEAMDPAFYHYPADALPRVSQKGVRLCVMMGEAFGVSSPVPTFARTLYAEVHLDAGSTLSLPQEAALAVYVIHGRIRVGDTQVQAEQMVMVPKPGLSLSADEDAHCVMIGGETLGKRYIEWNFVSSRSEHIEQAKADWRAGRFPTVPGDNQEWIPLPDEG